MTEYDVLINKLETLDPSDLDITANGEKAFDEIVQQLRERGIRLTTPLCNAIKFFRFYQWMPTDPTEAVKELVTFLQANRSFLEKVYSSGRFLPPFEVDFYDVSDKLQSLALRMMMAKGVRDPGRYIFVSPEHWRTRVVVILLPISDDEFHLIAATVHERRWYTPPSKANEHLRGLDYAVKRALKIYPYEIRKRIKSVTYIMLGRYTRNVRGGLKRLGMHPAKRAFLVFRDRRWLTHILTFLKNLYGRRLEWLRKRIRGEPYGQIKQMHDTFLAFLDALSLTTERNL